MATRELIAQRAAVRRHGAGSDAGVSPDGTGSHRIVIGSAAGTFTDPDGFAWDAASVHVFSGRE